MIFWRKQPILKGYVSELDRFLKKWDQKPEAHSSNRQAEESKHEAISRLRDTVGDHGSAFNWEDESNVI